MVSTLECYGCLKSITMCVILPSNDRIQESQNCAVNEEGACWIIMIIILGDQIGEFAFLILISLQIR